MSDENAEEKFETDGAEDGHLWRRGRPRPPSEPPKSPDAAALVIAELEAQLKNCRGGQRARGIGLLIDDIRRDPRIVNLLVTDVGLRDVLMAAMRAVKPEPVKTIPRSDGEEVALTC